MIELPPAQQALDFEGRTGRTHPDQSHTAAANVKAGSQRWQVLIALWNHPEGLTAWDLHIDGMVRNKAHEPVPPNQVAIRLLELRDQGLVKRTGFRRATTKGNTGDVHLLTDEGHALMTERVNDAHSAT